MTTANYVPQIFQPRFTAAAGAATVVTFALFLLMAALISSAPYQAITETTSFDIALPEPKKERPAELKPKLAPPPVQETITPKTSVTSDPLDNTLLPTGVPSPQIKVAIGGGLPTLQQPPSGDPSPIVRINPKYPVVAARNGVEGWVQLRFSVDATGAVTDIEVIAAQPQRVFEQEAIRALKRWKYQPSTVDGAATGRSGLQVQLDFSLEQSE
jgi:periplasmic protein TonB